MQTRLQIKQQMFLITNVYPINIDFENSSLEWMQNKKKNENGTYNYICNKKCKNGNICSRKVWLHSIFCKIHLKHEK